MSYAGTRAAVERTFAMHLFKRPETHYGPPSNALKDTYYELPETPKIAPRATYNVIGSGGADLRHVLVEARLLETALHDGRGDQVHERDANDEQEDGEVRHQERLPLDQGRVDLPDGVQRHELHEGQHGQPERAEVPAANKLISVDCFLNLARNGFLEFLR